MNQPRFTSGWFFQIRHYITYVQTIHREMVCYTIHSGIFSSWQVKTIVIFVMTNFPCISDQQEDAETLKRSIARKQGYTEFSRKVMDACWKCYTTIKSSEDKIKLFKDWFGSWVNLICRSVGVK